MLTDKKNKTKTCEFGSLEDSLICGKIVGSIDSKEMIKRLLRDSELTLNKAANMVRVFEISRIQVSGQKGKTAADSIQKSKVDLLVTKDNTVHKTYKENATIV